MIILTKPFNHKGTIFPKGSPVPGLSEEMIEKLIKNGAAKIVTDQKPGKTSENNKNSKDYKGKQDKDQEGSKDHENSDDQQNRETGKE